MQARTSPGHSLFSYEIGDILKGNEASSQPTIPEDIKVKLQDLLGVLDKDVNKLLQNAEPISRIYLGLEGLIPGELEEAILPVAYFEGYRAKVLKAKQRLSGRKGMIAHKVQVDNLHQMVRNLQSSRSRIEEDIDRLQAKKAALEQELQKIEEALAAEKKKLDQIPRTIEKLNEEKGHYVREAYRLHNDCQSGPTETDQQVIDEVASLHAHALDVIRNFLSL